MCIYNNISAHQKYVKVNQARQLIHKRCVATQKRNKKYMTREKQAKKRRNNTIGKQDKPVAKKRRISTTVNHNTALDYEQDEQTVLYKNNKLLEFRKQEAKNILNVLLDELDAINEYTNEAKLRDLEHVRIIELKAKIKQISDVVAGITAIKKTHSLRKLPTDVLENIFSFIAYGSKEHLALIRTTQKIADFLENFKFRGALFDFRTRSLSKYGSLLKHIPQLNINSFCTTAEIKASYTPNYSTKLAAVLPKLICNNVSELYLHDFAPGADNEKFIQQAFGNIKRLFTWHKAQNYTRNSPLNQMNILRTRLSKPALSMFIVIFNTIKIRRKVHRYEVIVSYPKGTDRIARKFYEYAVYCKHDECEQQKYWELVLCPYILDDKNQIQSSSIELVQLTNFWE